MITRRIACRCLEGSVPISDKDTQPSIYPVSSYNVSDTITGYITGNGGGSPLVPRLERDRGLEAPITVSNKNTEAGIDNRVYGYYRIKNPVSSKVCDRYITSVI